MNAQPCPATCAVPPRHLLLQWHLTERCNLACSHCYQEGAAAELPLEQLTDLLGQLQGWREALAGSYGRRPALHVNLTGGEPLVRSDLFCFLEHLGAAGVSWALLTNGTLIDEAVARHLALLRPRFVQVSIDGAEQTHDRIRGAGSHAAAVAGLRALARRRIPTMIAFTAGAANYTELPAVARLGRRLGVRRVWADRLVPLGRGPLEAVLSPPQTRHLVELLHQESRRRWAGRRTEVATRRALQFVGSTQPPYRCAAGESLLTVLANGDLCPCRRLPLVVGNVLQTPLAQLYRQSPLLQRLRQRDVPARGCERCYYAHTCGGGLRCLSQAVYGDPFVADPGCWLAARQDCAPLQAAP